jgi:hypothetical protein
VIAHAFAAMQAVWDLAPSGASPFPAETTRSRKGAAR